MSKIDRQLGLNTKYSSASGDDIAALQEQLDDINAQMKELGKSAKMGATPEYVALRDQANAIYKQIQDLKGAQSPADYIAPAAEAINNIIHGGGSQSQGGASAGTGSAGAGSGSPQSAGFKIPTWGWIVGGVVIVGGIAAVVLRKKFS